eukprot:TRINITY_DN555_c0_g1_i1.p1 TRINITY_DN555_c0_g1~~TRINITY_DN555_c0_g1_i1.p1  ORF type:complete len:383 (-),score=97.24 TRINITY_DN555_c0_g1_i1:56-1204(-)
MMSLEQHSSTSLVFDTTKADYAYEFKNWKLAFDLYKAVLRSSPNGHVFYRLGVMYKNGHFVKESDFRAREYFRLAYEKLSPLAVKGDSEALCDLGSMYEYGEGVEKNYERAVEYYKQSADKGYATAQCNLGYMFNNGRGVKMDRKIAAEYYCRASEQNHVRAQYNLGYLFKHGYGVIQDNQKAVQQYQLSAEQGYSKAQHNLGYMYSNGLGVEKDKKKAAYYYEQAAGQKNAMSNYNLALMYYRGEGIPKDATFAFKYFIEAAELGHREAKSQLEKMRALENAEQAANNPEYQSTTIGSQYYASQEWPKSHTFLPQDIQKAILEVVYLFRDIGWKTNHPDQRIPMEIIGIIQRWVIKVWPGVDTSTIIFDNYLKICDKSKKV